VAPGVPRPHPPLSPRQDERNQVLTSYLWVRQAWLDAHLTWDKDSYDGIDSIRVPSSYVWRPDIILYNKWAVLIPPPSSGGSGWGSGGGCTGVANLRAAGGVGEQGGPGVGDAR